MSVSSDNNVAANTLPAEEKDTSPVSKMWSVGGGKGGTGKSFVTLSLGIRLAIMNKRVVLIDADLGGANLHTLLGIRNPRYTLNDFIKKRVDGLNDVCIETQIPNLKLISGGDDILYLSNPKYSQKAKMLRHLNKLEADYILLDLGAGTSYNVLDFFIYTQGKMLVVSPFPTSIQNAYGFVKTALYRRLSQRFSKNDRVIDLINKSIDPGSNGTINSVVELMAAAEEIDQESASIMSQEIENFKLKIIVNMVRSEKDRKVGDIIRTVADKYLGIDVDVLSSVPFDLQVEKSIIMTNPLLLNENGNKATMSIYEIALALLKSS